MEPIPETAAALDQIARATESHLREELQHCALLVKAFVPDCVGLSLASLAHGVTFTLVASSEEIAVLDGIQYMYGGPCVDAAHTDEALEFNSDDETILDEYGWHQFARATAAHTIASTLSLPIVEDDRVIGTVNLYAASAQAFVGQHEVLAEIFGAWAPAAVTNADLAFSTRETARQAPQTLRDGATIRRAVAILVSASDLDLDEADHALQEAARRAGVRAVVLARTIVQIMSDPDIDS